MKNLQTYVWKNEIKQLEHTLKTYMYSHYNMCNILIYFCNIKMKHLLHPDETSEILKTYSYNMGFAWTNGGTPARRSTTGGSVVEAGEAD